MRKKTPRFEFFLRSAWRGPFDPPFRQIYRVNTKKKSGDLNCGGRSPSNGTSILLLQSSSTGSGSLGRIICHIAMETVSAGGTSFRSLCGCSASLISRKMIDTRLENEWFPRRIQWLERLRSDDGHRPPQNRRHLGRKVDDFFIPFSQLWTRWSLRWSYSNVSTFLLHFISGCDVI